MKVPKKPNAASACPALEALEDRRLMAGEPWGHYPVQVGLDRVVANYPWLDGAGFGVAVVDKGIDYLHPLLGGNPATGAVSPDVVNVYDFKDGDDNPFPDTSEKVDSTSPHATGVAGLLTGLPTVQGGRHYQGMLQGGRLYNLRTDSGRSAETIAQALEWVVANHERYNITAINLTDFRGEPSAAYHAQLKLLGDAGVFIAAPVANDWLGDEGLGIPPRQPIGHPATSPYVFGIGGALQDGTLNTRTQRGNALDMLGPSYNVSLPYYTPSEDAHVWTDRGRGSSWATPYVVGTAVLLRQIDPTLRPAEIMQVMKDSGAFVSDPDAANTGIAGYRRLDAYAAVNMTYARRDDASDQGGGNDTLARATPIGLDSAGKGSVTGRKLLIGDHDYYTFTAARAGQYGVTALAGAELMDAGGNVIGTVGTGALTRSLAAGTYYVHLVDARRTVDGTYAVGIAGPGNTGGGGGGGGTPGAAPPMQGTFNDVAYDAAGNLHVAWYDLSSRTLKYAVRDAQQSWGGVQTIDSGRDVGHFVSMELDGAGRPGVAYYDADNADLKYAKLNGSSWQAQTVVSTNTVGYYPSLRFDDADRPVIAYYYRSGGALQLAANDGGGWEVTTIDSKGDVGRYPSLALNPAEGRWAIAYETTSGGAFKYAQMTRRGWSTTVVDENGAGGGFISLAFDAADRPAFSYYDAKNADLKLARFDGAAWSNAAVASKNSQGLYSNLFFDGGSPVIYYFNKTGNTLNVARRGGRSWAYEVLATGGGRENRVGRGGDGGETYSWFEDAGGGLRVQDR